MDQVKIEVFSAATNQAVVRVPGRTFPGVVLQGDTLSGLLSAAEEILGELRAGGSPVNETEELAATLTGLLDHYERTLAAHGMPLPYVR